MSSLQDFLRPVLYGLSVVHAFLIAAALVLAVKGGREELRARLFTRRHRRGQL